MGEVSSELLLSVLKTIEARLEKSEQDLSAAREEIRVLRQNNIGAYTDVANLYAMAAKLEASLLRIEHRLELADATV